MIGPPAEELIDRIPAADLRQAMTDGIGALMGDLGDDTANVLLTLARIWSTLETGRFMAKDEAAEWAMDRLADEDRGALARARDVYRGTTADEWDGLDADARRTAGILVQGGRGEQ